MTPSEGYSHVTLTVTDLEESVGWYERALGLTRAVERTGSTWQRVLLRAPSGIRLGLTTHTGTGSRDAFNEERVGLDHLAFACADVAEVEAWAEHLDALGVPRGDVVDAGYATVLVVRDPDGIPIEFFADAG